ncbi:hypothetical protein HanRHA438_Chr12g0554871 [Helianthus annuus]|nr:hypothetical protein HanRHA438_Chr12g0554871 [Helianthus annuus]
MNSLKQYWHSNFFKSVGIGFFSIVGEDEFSLSSPSVDLKWLALSGCSSKPNILSFFSTYVCVEC